MWLLARLWQWLFAVQRESELPRDIPESGMVEVLKAPDNRGFVITSQHRSRNKSRPTHQGVDLNANWYDGDPAWNGFLDSEGRRKFVTPPDTVVVAGWPGTITSVQNGLVIQSLDQWPGFWVRYRHVAFPQVREGDHVDKGDELADASSVDTDVPHLHLEVRTLLAGKSVDIDPNPLLEGKRPSSTPATRKGGTPWAMLMLFLILSELR